MLRTVVCAFLSAALVAGSSTSWAAPKPTPAAPAGPAQAPSEAGADEARYHFSQAVALYRDKNFNAALAEFQASYQLRPSPELLYNIGLTQKALFRYGEAIDSLTRYLAETKSASAERRAEVTQVIAEIRALLSEVSLDIHPEGATVSIDGRRVGQAPLAPFSLAAGYHVLEASAVDYESASKELTVVAGKPLALALTLKALPKTGLARIIPVPSLAMVRVDGKLVGTGTLELELIPGNHQLEVSAPGYRPRKSEMAIALRERHTINVELVPLPEKPPLYRRWWLWTVVGAVAGGAATAIAVPLGTRPVGPIDGTLGTVRTN